MNHPDKTPLERFVISRQIRVKGQSSWNTVATYELPGLVPPRAIERGLSQEVATALYEPQPFKRPTEKPTEPDIKAWVRDLVHGAGGIHDQVNRGDGSGCDGTDPDACCCEASISFALRALGNPRMEDADKVIQAILGRRVP